MTGVVSKEGFNSEVETNVPNSETAAAQPRKAPYFASRQNSSVIAKPD
jgi:hypothetical protein